MGAPEGAPLGMPEALPDGGEQDCWLDVPLFEEEDEESPEPQATRARGESASSATAGTRRTGITARFMRNSSRDGEEGLRQELNQRRLGLP
ncbi:hypothetical protein SAMN04487983_1019123 [Streptomyces sp. yr375]|nr:hypothetical protein SAMN04487983_1019123 [Streptomyces sp. yr375]